MKILIADKLSEKAIENLKNLGTDVEVKPSLTAGELPAEINNAEILIVRSTKVTAETMDAGKSLSLIIRAGAGVNTIDINHASKLGINVANCPGKNSDAVAELAMGLIIAADRKIAFQAEDLKKGIWNKKEYGKASGLKGRTLGILGYGSIGKGVAERAKAFGMNIAAWSRSLNKEKAEKDNIIFCADPVELAEISDVVSVHLAVSSETENIVNKDFFNAMKNGAVFVNTSRGEIVDQKALADAVREKNIKAALDVYRNEPSAGDTQFTDTEIAGLITGTHHIGASTEQASEAIADETVKIVKSYIENGKPLNLVNAQSKSPAPCALVIRHNNRVGVLANVLNIIREADINVEEMENMIFSGGEAAVCSLKLSRKPSGELLDKINSRENIIKAVLI